MNNNNFANAPLVVIGGLLITLFVGMPSVLEYIDGNIYKKPKPVKIIEPITIVVPPKTTPTNILSGQDTQSTDWNTPNNSSEKKSTPSRTSDATPISTSNPTSSKIPLKPNEVQAVINDSDGYTNVRSGQGSKYDIIDRIAQNEVFYTIPQQSDWWPVRTKDNKLGYMHQSRIRIQN
jgi:hypothetical protein